MSDQINPTIADILDDVFPEIVESPEDYVDFDQMCDAAQGIASETEHARLMKVLESNPSLARGYTSLFRSYSDVRKLNASPLNSLWAHLSGRFRRDPALLYSWKESQSRKKALAAGRLSKGMAIGWSAVSGLACALLAVAIIPWQGRSVGQDLIPKGGTSGTPTQRPAGPREVIELINKPGPNAPELLDLLQAELQRNPNRQVYKSLIIDLCDQAVRDDRYSPEVKAEFTAAKERVTKLK